MATAQVLKNIYLFKNMDENEMNQLSQIATEKIYSPGQDVFVAGQEARAFYVIRMGTIKIYSSPTGNQDMNITNMGTGSHFGELPMVDQGKRSATAQAVEATTLLEIDYGKLHAVLEKNDKMAHKFYRELSRYLAARLRATTENLQHAQELKLKHF